MGNNSKDYDVRNLINNILSNNINSIEDVKKVLTIIDTPLDISMILLALDISDLQTGTLKLVANQFKNILLENYLMNNNNTNESSSSISFKDKENKLEAVNTKDNNNYLNYYDNDIKDEDYNDPDSPIITYGEESADGFIYIDGRHALPYEPLTEEKALKYVFLEKKLLPPKGSKGHIDQRFEYYTDDNEARMCVRRFVIDDRGHVVRFLGEHTKPIDTNNYMITDDDGFTNGALADLLNIQD